MQSTTDRTSCIFDWAGGRHWGGRSVRRTWRTQPRQILAEWLQQFFPDSIWLESVKSFGSLSNYSRWHEMPKVTFHKQMVSVCSCPANFATWQTKYFFFQLWNPNYFFEQESPNNFLTWNPEHNNQHTDWNIVEANFQKPSQIFSISSSSKWCGWLVV